ncbi:glutamyl-Q tRNA(Asp) synthetase [Aeromicrobium flavum]|uniref:Glutamyl-Q tRNA(Asp) synthetase n=1 Tax=Aeromicrobium flavum TaxID=416568 RepID=A0A512HSW1_9ACTN|nr:tRNA glutamyl-Q(34) synthetase GluQRS [Aeromicrobium flavum]GEO88527.1 glutamyl-Q tRNA(Asp) synthetase [Aeromicrobium flavum]
MSAGRFAPSPSGDLHLGNLRTAILAWLFARATDRSFLVRVEDLDRQRSRPEFERTQLEDLAALGLTWDPPVVRQSERDDRYAAALDRLTDAGLTFECFCTRREVAEAVRAPHHPPGAYPGTCRDLTEAERAERRAERVPAIRLRAQADRWVIHDALHGEVDGHVDDVVLRRGDGAHAYNLAVVVDDGEQGVDQVVRGDDLLDVAPAQAHLAHLLGLPEPAYAHVPLALNAAGRRLAKRDGAVTLRDLSPGTVWDLIGDSLGVRARSPEALLAELDPADLPRKPWILTS